MQKHTTEQQDAKKELKRANFLTFSQFSLRSNCEKETKAFFRFAQKYIIVSPKIDLQEPTPTQKTLNC